MGTGWLARPVPSSPALAGRPRLSRPRLNARPHPCPCSGMPFACGWLADDGLVRRFVGRRFVKRRKELLARVRVQKGHRARSGQVERNGRRGGVQIGRVEHDCNPWRVGCGWRRRCPRGKRRAGSMGRWRRVGGRMFTVVRELGGWRRGWTAGRRLPICSRRSAARRLPAPLLRQPQQLLLLHLLPLLKHLGRHRLAGGHVAHPLETERGRAQARSNLRGGAPGSRWGSRRAEGQPPRSCRPTSGPKGTHQAEGRILLLRHPLTLLQRLRVTWHPARRPACPA
eukprot:scaffold13462_cov87-Isochrysis_galbana.AAC.1